ncbi:MAG: glycosyltransferase family 2 protein [Chloroflexi bacterium]|nr:glycosyltransferase family 2 protein [Chloroflexota bacterium]
MGIGRPAETEGTAHPLLASIVIVNYNGWHHLQRCLPSLLQEEQQDCEIVLVDNASSDGSPAHVARAFPRVRLIRNVDNLGFAQGGNLGAAHAQGQYLAFLNPDTVVEAGWLQALIAALEADAQAGLATSKILLLSDPARINTCGNEMHYTGLTLCRGLGRERESFPTVEEVSAVSGAAFAVRRELFQALGGFDPDLFMYMEDTDLSWRARLAGRTCLCVPSSVVLHDYALRFGPDKTFYQERNRYLLLLKGLRWRTLLLLLPALLLAEVVTWGFVLLREPRRLGNKLRAYAWIVSHWSHIQRKRQQAQSSRRVRDRQLLARCTFRLDYGQAGRGPIARLASWLFDPLFGAWQRLALALMGW